MEDVVITITGKFTDGKMRVDVKGPLDKPCLMLKMMAIAEETVKGVGIQNEMAVGPGIVLANGHLPPAALAKGR